jgi:hypothetical protein
MKKYIITILLFALAYYSSAQQTDTTMPSKTKADIFLARTGTLLKKNFEELGYVGKTKIEVFTITDLISGDSIKSIKFSLIYATTYATDTKINTLDIDELNGLIAALLYIQKNVVVNKPKDKDEEVIFISNSGFQTGCYFNKFTWKLFIKVEKYDSRSYDYYTPEELSNFIRLLRLAQEKIGSYK